MSNNDVTFGWVIYPVPRGQSDAEMATPTLSGRALMEANERYIEAARPHFDAVWVEDHFQWENKPTLEAMTTLSYLAGSAGAGTRRSQCYSICRESWRSFRSTGRE